MGKLKIRMKEGFNAMIWERIPKPKYVALSQLELGVYDAVVAFNIGMKSSVLIFEKLGMILVFHLVKGCQSLNLNIQTFVDVKLQKTLRKLRNLENVCVEESIEKLINLKKRRENYMELVFFIDFV